MDEHEGKIPPLVHGISNSATRDSGGAHWVAYRNSPQDKQVVYWDSFGMSPDPRLLKYLKSTGKPVMMNTTQLQNLNAQSCGYWCLMVLSELNRGQSIGSILSKVNSQDQDENEEMLRIYF
jgi:hypothetical protein